MLDNHEKFCNIPDLISCQKCIDDKSEITANGEFRDIKNWRLIWGKFLNSVDEIRCFSNSSREIIRKAYPLQGKISVIPHQIDYIKPVINSVGNFGLNIGVIGTVNEAKGSKIINKMVELIDDKQLNIKIIVIGSLSHPVRSKNLIITGHYNKEDLPDLVEEHAIDIFFISSVWPETFSYTAEEAMKMCMPLAVFNIGAPAERVKHYEKGLVINRINSGFALDCILSWVGFNQNLQYLSGKLEKYLILDQIVS